MCFRFQTDVHVVKSILANSQEANRMLRILLIILIVLAFGNCSEKTSDNSSKKLTQQQRDSVLAESDLPGARVVGKAIAVSDSAAARADRLNELTK